MSRKHPSFAHPTITEVVCELHYRLAEGKPWKPSYPGDLFKRIGDTFPEIENVMEMAWQVEVGPQGIGQRIVPARPRMRYKHATRPLLLQFSEAAVTVNVLPDYPGWKVVRQECLNAWKDVRAVVQPAGITRIGLRYINRLERSAPAESPGKWLRAGTYIPPSVEESALGLLFRNETQLDAQNRIIITIGDQLAPEGETQTPHLIFDIDRVMEQDVPIENTKLGAVLDRLHADVWEIFAGAKTEALTRLLEGETP